MGKVAKEKEAGHRNGKSVQFYFSKIFITKKKNFGGGNFGARKGGLRGIPKKSLFIASLHVSDMVLSEFREKNYSRGVEKNILWGSPPKPTYEFAYMKV